MCNEPDVGNELDVGNEDDFTESNKHLDYSHWTDNDDADVGENLNSPSHLSPQSTSTSESDIVVLCNPSPLPSQELLLQSSQRSISHVSELESIKGKLRIKQYKEFQLEAIQALQLNNDVIVVQPTGSGKSLCYTASALLNPGKITLVIEPIVAVITDQVWSLKNKGLDVVALGRAAGADKLTNFRRVFVDSSNLPLLAFCTPEYLFGTPASSSFLAAAGQFSALKEKEDWLNLIAVDEAHKIFDRMPSFRPAFDSLRKLKELKCNLMVMSATLTNEQIKTLKSESLHCDNCVVLTHGVNRDNLKLHLRKYQYKRKPVLLESCVDDSDEDCSADETGENSATVIKSSAWHFTVEKIRDVVKEQPVLLYLDYVRDVEQVVDVFHDHGIKATKYTGRMTVNERCEPERAFLEGRTSILVATESFELGVNNPNINEVIRVGAPRNLGVLLQEFGRVGRKAGVLANAYLFFSETIDDKRLGLWLKSSLESEIDEAHKNVKEEILSTYKKTWHFVYSVYHGKCLLWAICHTFMVVLMM